MIRLLILLGVIISGLLSLSGPGLAAPKAKVAEIENVLGLRSYLESLYKHYNLDRRDQFHIRVVDLDSPPDRIEEVIISVNPLEGADCGPRGCPQEVLRRGIMDSLITVDMHLGPRIVLDEPYLKKVRALLARSHAAGSFGEFLPREVYAASVPGLADYLSKRFGPDWKKKEEIFLIRTIDLDEAGDVRADEVLLSVDRFDADYCDNTGCEHEVLVRQGDGSLKAVTSFRGFGLKVADTTTNGVRDLITETSKGNRPLNLHGQTTATQKSGPPAPSIKEISIHWPDIEEEFRSTCYQFRDWAAGRLRSRDGTVYGVAAHGHCGQKSRWIVMRCKPGSQEIELMLPDTLDRVEKGTAITIPWFIDGKRFDIQGIALKEKPSIDPTPFLTFQRSNGFLDALKKGTRGSYQIGGPPGSRFWLKDAHKAIDTMLTACDGAPGRESHAQANPGAQTGEAKVARLPNDIIEYRPDCFDRHNWFGQSGNGAGSATYGGCGDGEYWFQFSCRADSENIHLTIESILNRARDGMAITVPVMADGKKFNLRGKAQFSEMLGGAQPLVSFERSNGLMQALMSASQAAFLINRKKEPFHLHGAKGSIETMLKGCDGTGGPPRSGAQAAPMPEQGATAATRKPVITVTRAHVTGKGFAYSRDKYFESSVCKGTTHVEVVNSTGRRQEIWMGPPDSGFVDRKIWLRNGQKARIDLYRLTTGEQLPEYTVLNAAKDFSHTLKLVDCDEPRAASAKPPAAGHKPSGMIIPYGKTN